MDERSRIDHPAWPLRAVILAALGACFGLVFHWLTGAPDTSGFDASPLRAGAAAFVAVSGIAFAFSLERRRWTWSVAFAAAGGLIAGFVAAWNGAPNDWGSGESWQFFSGILAVAIAVPLFQAVRDNGRRRPETATVHAYVWTNLILWSAACAFVAATMVLTLLLAALFHLIGINFLRDLMEHGWFMWPLACGAFGGAVGLLRDRDQVLGTLQKVGRAVLSVLAPVLALGLLLFVLALPFTGLQPLWDQTQATTPILLACIVGAIILANAVIGNAADEEARSPALRWPAIGLALVMPPLAFVAAVSTGKRIGQYGLTPDRLWACVFVLAAAGVALAYLYALARRRGAWAEGMRSANIGLAAAFCLLALLLALPIVSFGAISTRNQIARLESGKVAPDRFDWAAMRFDFGPSGRRALERLAASPNLVLRQRAREALSASTRWAMGPDERIAPERSKPAPVRLQADGGATIPPTLADLIGRSGQCHDEICRVVFVEPKRAAVLRIGCAGCSAYLFDAEPDGTWVQRLPPPPMRTVSTAPPSDTSRGRVEIRKVERQQLFVDGRPAGEPFE
jgi:hypothetical protein